LPGWSKNASGLKNDKTERKKKYIKKEKKNKGRQYGEKPIYKRLFCTDF
jgi:hypothetical protein